MENASVDVQALHAALDATRTARGLSWRQLAKELGVSPSTISRMANGLRPDVTAFAAMTTWLGMSADDFIVRPQDQQGVEPELVAAMAPLLRARRDLSPTDVQYLEEIIGAAARRFEAERQPQDG
ncbi:helix-turn-helix domain-containing protein [Janibacter melonis]|uniref:helix-turn-helix domain-containing protein n=1 Tax=Janibacter melonis TaxID=262209 RepID=UPI002044CCC8|nr:helix-turn-helix domain-containing protein [Janibacter melonis]MCM3556704.1 helix-turn-helix domain-containing protein [Janibacter melonis]